MMKNLVLVGVAFALAASPAYAKKAELSKAQQVLVEIAQNETESMQMVMDAIDAHEPLPVSEDAKAKWEEAQDAHKAAVKLWKKQQYADAYDKFTEAGDLVQPALTELLAADSPPQDVVDAGAQQVSSLAKMVDGLAHAVQEHATDDVKAKYTEAKGLYDEAKAEWADPTQRRDAAQKSWQAMKTLNEGLRMAWDEQHAA